MNSSDWVVETGSLHSAADSLRGGSLRPDVFAELRAIARALDAPLGGAHELIKSAILKHTFADAAGLALFGAAGYMAPRDCPIISSLPSLQQLVEHALERHQVLSAHTAIGDGIVRHVLIAPITAGDNHLGVIWAANNQGIAARSEDEEIIGLLADLAALVPSANGSSLNVYNRSAGFRALINNIQDYAIFTVDPSGIVTDWTEGAQQVLGYSASEAVGQHFEIFFTAEDASAMVPQKELAQAAIEGRAERESWRVRRDGEWIWVNAISSAIRDENGVLVGFVKIARDLTERRQTEMQREELEARLAAELQDMNHLHDLSMRLFETGDFSRMLEQILAATIELQHADLGTIQLYDPVEDQFTIVAHQGFALDVIRRFRVMPRDSSAASGRAFETGQRVIVSDIELDTSDSALRGAARAEGFRAMQCTPILSRDGRVKGMLATHFRRPHTPSARDFRLTDLYMRLASELITRAEDAIELRNARQIADKANQAKSRFLATASHDLRQPLQSLSLLSGTLRRMATNPYLLEAVEQQELAIASMSGLLNALLDISKLDSGSIQPALHHVKVSDLFDQMRIEFVGLAAKKGLTLEIRPCADSVYSDPTLLGQILRNLLSNALRYTERGTVTLCAEVHDTQMAITVRDTGIGIDEAHLERIFEEFYQVDVQPNSIREGHGLGLSIVHRTALILGHDLDVESAVGQGSSFRISVPLGRAKEPEPMQESSSPQSLGKSSHILLIDDDPGVLKATRLLLEVEGYRVSIGKTVADARAAAIEHSDIQLLISDYHLADGESGRAAIEIVRELLPRVEVILMTGDTSSGLKQVSPSDRICVASKPINADALLAMIKRLLTAEPVLH